MQMSYDIKSYLDLVWISLKQVVNRNVRFIECTVRPVKGGQTLIEWAVGDKSITAFCCNVWNSLHFLTEGGITEALA